MFFFVFNQTLIVANENTRKKENFLNEFSFDFQ